MTCPTRGVVARLMLAAVAPLLLGACVGGSPSCNALPTEIELRLTATSLTPADPAVCRDRSVTLFVSSEVEGVLHIHGYDAELPAATITAGETTELAFAASRVGQFPIELHTDEDTQGVGVGVFTVHEP